LCVTDELDDGGSNMPRCRSKDTSSVKGKENAAAVEEKQNEGDSSCEDVQIEESTKPFPSYVLHEYWLMNTEPWTTRARGGDANSCSGDNTGSSQTDSKTACNSATACTTSDVTDATAHHLKPEISATTAPGQSGILFGSDSKGLGGCFAREHDSESIASNTSGYESRGTSSSKSGSKQVASDTNGVAVGGLEAVRGSNGGASRNKPETQPQSVNGETDGAGNGGGEDGSSGGKGQKENNHADKDSTDKGRHNAAKDVKKQAVYVVHLESKTLCFKVGSANGRHYQVGRPLEWSSK